MNQEIYSELIRLAKQNALTTYSDIALLTDLSMESDVDRNELSTLLAEIAESEQVEGRPMLTAIVVHSGGDNNPGEGFFSLAHAYGRFSGSRLKIDRLTYWVSEVHQVHSHWI